VFFDFLEDCLAVWYITWWVMIAPDAPIEEDE
jgi:hypothetical protein